MRDDNLLINTAVWGNKKDDVNMNGLANWAMSAREGLGFIVRALFFDTAHKSQHNGDKRRGLTGENLCAKVKKNEIKKKQWGIQQTQVWSIFKGKNPTVHPRSCW